MASKKMAVLQVRNVQYLVREGETVEMDKQTGKAGDKVKFDEVLLKSDAGKVEVGAPTVAKASVEGAVVDQIKGEKVRSFSYKAKARERKTRGHREQLTLVKITKIN